MTPVRIPVALLLSLFAWIAVREAIAETANSQSLAARILEDAGCRGGLVVHLGCGDGRLTAALCAGDGFLVHGLDRDPENVERAREHLQSRGLYGRVSVDTLDGPALPYADRLVRLLVAEDLGDIARDEAIRVIAPGGALCTKTENGWTCTAKPWPAQLDQWTHHLHDAGGNPVAQDSEVGPPRRLRWTAGPRWARSHGFTPSTSAMVSADGRLFSIVDETLNGLDDSVPAKWFLVARDAFSGVELWRIRLSRWGSAALSGTPDTGRGVTTGRFTMPPHVGKRLVAIGRTVYATLGPAAPVTALDAATGETKRVYAETESADEILVSDGRLIAAVNPAEPPAKYVAFNRKTPPPAPGKKICAVDTETGRLLWEQGPFSAPRTAKGQDPFGRLELAAGDGRVFALTSRTIECLNAESGRRLWQIDRPKLPDEAVRRIGFAGMYEFGLSVMLYHDGVVLLAQPEPNTHHTYHTMPGTLYAFDAADGSPMWKHAYGAWGHCTQPDVFVVGDAVWTHVDAETEYGSCWRGGYRARDTSQVDYRIQALDLRTGKSLQEISTRDIFNVGHHHRCYRNKITERYLMSSRRGVEFVDLATGENQQHHWVRSGCLLGNLPCNGLLYVAPHPCGCYLEAKLTGFNALAPSGGEGEKGSGGDKETGRRGEGERLSRGPACVAGSRLSVLDPQPSEWSTYRHDARRSGGTEAVVGTELAVAWRAEVGGRLSGLTVAGSTLLVADVDGHTVHALGADDGKPLWSHTAAARVDSPPTLFQVGRSATPSHKTVRSARIHPGGGRLSANVAGNTDRMNAVTTNDDGLEIRPTRFCVFGAADGRVTCLGAADGALAWHFDAAPERRLIGAFGRLESPWPVAGSVLLHQGKLHFAAGRSSYLDGGIRAYCLGPVSGEVERERTICSADPESGKMAPTSNAHGMPGVLGDVLGSDGTYVFLRQMNVWSPDTRAGRHLFSSGGYLDSTWFNRTYWKVDGVKTTGQMVLGDDVVFGVEMYAGSGRDTLFKPGANGYRLACYSLGESAVASQPKRRGKKGPGRKVVWQQQVPVRITAMVRAADLLFAAGSPDVVDPKDPHAAWEGRQGGILAAFDTATGKKLAEWKLPAPPTWDGMAAVEGRLYVSTVDGKVTCLAKP